MSYLLSSLESINDNRDGFTDDSFEEIFANEISVQEEMNEVVDDINELTGSMSRILEDIEFLENASNIFEEYGVSKELVMMVDPDGKLAEHSVFVSAESYEPGVFVSADEEITMKVGGMISSFYKWIKKQLAKIKEFIGRLYRSVMNLFGTSMNTLKKLYESNLRGLKDSDFDPEKIKKIKIDVPAEYSNIYSYVDDCFDFATIFEKSVAKFPKVIDDIINDPLKSTAVNTFVYDIKQKFSKYVHIVTTTKSSDKDSAITSISIKTSDSKLLKKDKKAIELNRFIDSPSRLIDLVEELSLNKGKANVKQIISEYNKIYDKYSKKIEDGINKLSEKTDTSKEFSSYKTTLVACNFLNQLAAHVGATSSKMMNLVKLCAIKLAKTKK